MIFQTHTPVFPLNCFIENLIYFDEVIAPHTLDRFLPDGNTEIIINLTQDPQYIYDNNTLQKVQACRSAWVSGLRTQPITIPSGTGSRMLVVAFRRGRAFPFYPFPLSELTDIVVEANMVFGRTFDDLREKLLAAKSIALMFEIVEEFLLQQAGKAIEEDTATRCIDHAVSSIIHRPSLQRLRQLSDEIGYSQKHFIDIFRRQVGVSPKQYLKIMRFQKAICTMESHELIPWSHVALESGYYDQAHFIRDFKYFSGFTPHEYLEKRTATLNYVPVH